ncbi:rhomboid family intramembrane serine protease, partial [Cutibacterium granulosum]
AQPWGGGSDGRPQAKPRANSPQLGQSQPDPAWPPPQATQMSDSRSGHSRTTSRGRRRHSRSTTSQTPIVTYTIIAICVIVWLAELVFPGFVDQIILVPALGATQPWRFVTSAFAHAPEIVHILFNMYALWALGRALEIFLGRARYVAAYALSALAGGVVYVAMASPGSDGTVLPYWGQGVLGASGAIFGMFGVLLVVQRKLGMSNRSLWVVLALNFGLAFFFPGIAWQAHVGGFLAGLASGWIFFDDANRVSRGSRPATWRRMGVLTLVLLAIAVVKYLLV